MDDVSSIHKPSRRDSQAEQIRRLKELIAEAESAGRPTELARQLHEQ